jgi:hypothetical protein
MIKLLRRGGTLPTSIQQLVRRTLLQGTCAVTVGLALTACATGHARGGASDGAPQAVVRLTNDLNPPSDITVYAVSDGGFRQLLGDVPPNQQKVLHFPITGATERVRLVAERGIQRPVRSQPIVLTGNGTVINWDLSTNSVWFPTDARE